MIDRDTFTVEEWAKILSAPAAVGALVVTADPSGPMGVIGEFRAIMNSMKEYVGANATNSPLLAAIQTYLSTKPTEEEEAQLKQWAEQQHEQMKANKPKTPEEMNERIHANIDETLELLTARGATDVDMTNFKAMMVAVAEAVAYASKEDTFLGFGGVRVSEAEEATLAQIRAELSA
jgi:hypothetical protein